MSSTCDTSPPVDAATPGHDSGADGGNRPVSGWWSVPNPSPLPSLTGLRWLAAALVFVFHLGVVGFYGGTPGSVLSEVSGAGAGGVSLFFVLSGYVLAWSHVDGRRVRSFYARRLARVWPAHALWVVLALGGAVTVGATRAGDGALAAGANLFLVSAWVPGWWQAGNPVTWSLVCEAFFYAAFPLVWWSVRRLRTPGGHLVAGGLLGAAAWLLPVGLQWVHLTNSAVAAAHHPLARWPEFAVGVVAAAAIRSGVWRGPRLRTAVTVWVASYAGASLADSHLPLAGVMIAGDVLLVSALARCDRDGGRTGLRGPRAQHLGVVSYAFYLAHLTVLGALAAAWPQGHPRLPALPATGLAVAALLLALAAAGLTYRLVERPGRRLLLTASSRSYWCRCCTQSAGTRPAGPGVG